MRLPMIYLMGALIVASAPFAACAQPSQTAPQPDAAADQTTPPAPAPCRRPGWVWEPAGYLTHGIWRPAHCAPRNSFELSTDSD